MTNNYTVLKPVQVEASKIVEEIMTNNYTVLKLVQVEASKIVEVVKDGGVMTAIQVEGNDFLFPIGYSQSLDCEPEVGDYYVFCESDEYIVPKLEFEKNYTKV